MERKLDAAQEVIIDQEQTIEKFRELVRHLQADILELRERGESQQREGESRESIGGSASPVMNLNVQLKSSTIKAHSRVSEGDQETSLHFSLGTTYGVASFPICFFFHTIILHCMQPHSQSASSFRFCPETRPHGKVWE